jgi:hypothetical protein
MNYVARAVTLKSVWRSLHDTFSLRGGMRNGASCFVPLWVREEHKSKAGYFKEDKTTVAKCFVCALSSRLFCYSQCKISLLFVPRDWSPWAWRRISVTNSEIRNLCLLKAAVSRTLTHGATLFHRCNCPISDLDRQKFLGLSHCIVWPQLPARRHL